ncbi:putative AP2 protein [Hordeum vulgare]|nr:putative AP2 protein [Hordeum vulgare]
MSLHRRGSSGFRGVRERPSDTFYADIHSGDMCLGLGTFHTADEAAHAYDAAAWRLGQPHRVINFPKRQDPQASRSQRSRHGRACEQQMAG